MPHELIHTHIVSLEEVAQKGDATFGFINFFQLHSPAQALMRYPR
ncbi:hypothetical protein [Spirosoma fluminis]